MWAMWLIISGVCLVIEFINISFFMFWFGIGALLAMVTSFFTSNVYIQIGIFILSSSTMLFFTRKFVNIFSRSDKSVATNAYSIVGKKGIVIKDIDPVSGQGQIKVGTEVWSAKSLEDRKIENGIEVEVVEINGVKAVVK